MLEFKILGIPTSKQSARFYATQIKGKTTVRSYQKASVKQAQQNIREDVLSQLPEGHVPYDEPLEVIVTFVFPIPASLKKSEKKFIEEGGIVYKPTKPDIVDNLMKGLFDAMNGIVFIDDSRICKAQTRKIYGPIPQTLVKISPATPNF